MEIDHVVVLMLENNSFDRMLGWMPGVDGVDVAHPRSNQNLAGTAVEQRTKGTREMKSDPAHDLSDVVGQMAGPGAAEQNIGVVIKFHRAYVPNCVGGWGEV